MFTNTRWNARKHTAMKFFLPILSKKSRKTTTKLSHGIVEVKIENTTWSPGNNLPEDEINHICRNLTRSA